MRSEERLLYLQATCSLCKCMVYIILVLIIPAVVSSQSTTKQHAKRAEQLLWYYFWSFVENCSSEKLGIGKIFWMNYKLHRRYIFKPLSLSPQLIFESKGRLERVESAIYKMWVGLKTKGRRCGGRDRGKENIPCPLPPPSLFSNSCDLHCNTNMSSPSECTPPPRPD